MSKLVPGENLPNTAPIGKKDAFHAPAVIVVSEFDIPVGGYVKFTDNNHKNVIETSQETKHGIADPFLVGTIISAGTPFWMMLSPGVVQDLVHSFEINATIVKKLPRRNDYDDDCRGCYGDDNGGEDDGCRGCYE